jgi:hypothetical protein
MKKFHFTPRQNNFLQKKKMYLGTMAIFPTTQFQASPGKKLMRSHLSKLAKYGTTHL